MAMAYSLLFATTLDMGDFYDCDYDYDTNS